MITIDKKQLDGTRILQISHDTARLVVQKERVTQSAKDHSERGCCSIQPINMRAPLVRASRTLRASPSGRIVPVRDNVY
ncbi:hypothetical protein EVAR_6098_1 [Eumeta japonica]|uniref:Uncharacterized protein n=1 Tax=Eumeta variegata TaxID=151549 RepID=A0A4C1TF91_EUMVA|nr:hypothetical protein EVAR_6098_1 [Eumeta japonica]